MRVDLVASEQHYLTHLLPIFAALPEHLRGELHPFRPPGHVRRPAMGGVALVAGWQDVEPLRGQCQMIYVEHGAGQAYVDAPSDPSYSYSGGAAHRGVIGFIAPSQRVADRWTSAPSCAVGSPKLDVWRRSEAPSLNEPTVVLAWHWECTLTQETRSAWKHFETGLPEVVERWKRQGWRVALHFHPKWRGRMDHVAFELGAELFESEGDVFRRANVLCVDNSSLGYEFATLGRPVLTLNAPWYRRDVEHGLRFWEFPPGPMFDSADELACVNLWDLFHETELRAWAGHLMSKASTEAYAYAGTAVADKAADRAAAFIEQLLANR